MNKSNKKQLRLLKKISLSNFDNLYKKCEGICKIWKITAIPLQVLKEMIDESISIYKDETITELALKDFIDSYVHLMKSLYRTCDKTAKKMNSKSLPLDYLKAYIEHIKALSSESMKESFK